jgi:hypothetical protein
MIPKPGNDKKILKRAIKAADRAFQEWGRKVYKLCEACGKPMSCLHHFWPKSQATNLRYDQDNGVPVCVGCHFKHHNGDPTIHEKITARRGAEWRKRLDEKKRTLVIIPSLGWYQLMKEKFTRLARLGIKDNA